MSLGLGAGLELSRGELCLRHWNTPLILSCFLSNMANNALRSSRLALRLSPFGLQCNWRSIARRTIATKLASGDESNLPLAGIKVLDMTRVLAGVSTACFNALQIAYSHEAVLHSDIRRPWVCEGQPCTDQHLRLVAR